MIWILYDENYMKLAWVVDGQNAYLAQAAA